MDSLVVVCNTIKQPFYWCFIPRSTQPSIPPGSVNEYQLRLGRQRQVWLISIADECVGVQVKLWNPLRTRAIPERFCGGDSLREALYQVYAPLPLPLQKWVYNTHHCTELQWDLKWSHKHASINCWKGWNVYFWSIRSWTTNRKHVLLFTHNSKL